MNHCVRTYADTLLINECRLWSLRREGKRIATLEVRNQEHGLACIGQLRGLSNAPVDRDIWWIASRWLLRVDLRQIAPLPADSWDNIPGADAAFARRFWAAYWLDKGRFPEWLPYAHARRGPYNPLDAQRHDDARFRRRRLRRVKALPDIW